MLIPDAQKKYIQESSRAEWASYSGGGMSRQYRNQDIRVGVIGLGYVGLPIAIEMGRYFSTIGFDRDTKRIDELQQGIDKTLEVSDSEFLLAKISVFPSVFLTSRNANFCRVRTHTG